MKIFRFFSLLPFLIFPLFNLLLADEVGYIQKNAIAIQSNKVPPQLLEVIKNKKIVLFGETHGTSEFPDYALQVVQAASQYHPVSVGLEFPKFIQGDIENFLKTGNDSILKRLPFFQNSTFHSGRGSKAMVQFLKNINSTANIKVFCFDINEDENSSDRDTKMAKNILEYLTANPDRIVFTYSGNIHSRLIRGFPGNPDYPTMGSEIIRLSAGKVSLKNSTNVLFRYSLGSAWQCWMKDKKPDCGIKNFSSTNSPYESAVNLDHYFLVEKDLVEGHLLTVFIRNVSASLPF